MMPAVAYTNEQLQEYILDQLKRGIQDVLADPTVSDPIREVCVHSGMLARAILGGPTANKLDVITLRTQIEEVGHALAATGLVVLDPQYDPGYPASPGVMHLTPKGLRQLLP